VAIKIPSHCGFGTAEGEGDEACEELWPFWLPRWSRVDDGDVAMEVSLGVGTD
jgi:hypothetical protein